MPAHLDYFWTLRLRRSPSPSMVMSERLAGSGTVQAMAYTLPLLSVAMPSMMSSVMEYAADDVKLAGSTDWRSI